MQLNNITALGTALVSAVIGFGLAFYIERKLSSRMQKKSQKILTYIAMTSFGYGLMSTLNEVIGFPLQGLNIRYDKLAGFLLANMLFLPILLLAIAKFIGLNSKAVDIDLGAESNLVKGIFFKYFLVLAGALTVAYFGFVVLEGNSADAKYDLYSREDYTNCNSPFDESPTTLQFAYKKETNEIFMTSEYVLKGIKKQDLTTLDNCSVLDVKNWTCGGEWSGGYRSSKFSMVNGEFMNEDLTAINKDDANCPVKIVRR